MTFWLIKQVLDAIGETVPCVSYDRWIVYNGGRAFPCVANASAYHQTILEGGGPEALRQAFKRVERVFHCFSVG